MNRAKVSWRWLVVLWAASLCFPVVATGREPLGTVRGGVDAKVALDQTTTWLALNARSLPILDGGQVRTSADSATVELREGGRLDVLPFSALRVEREKLGTGVVLEYGRLRFQVPVGGVLIKTSTAVLQPVGAGAVDGEVFVSSDGLMGVRMSQGSARVVSLRDSAQTMLASLEPVFLPRRPPRSGVFFASDVAPLSGSGARAVFNPAGRNVGYLLQDGILVVRPGFTADLTRPIPSRLTRLAMAAIPGEQHVHDAVPLFDVGGQYVGYLAGPVFHAQSASEGGRCDAESDADTRAQCLAAAGESSGAGATAGGATVSTTKAWAFGAGALAAVGAGGAGVAFAGSGSTPPRTPSAATPFAP